MIQTRRMTSMMSSIRTHTVKICLRLLDGCLGHEALVASAPFD